MKIFLAVFICKTLYFIGKRVGKGSSLPGKIVLKIFPDVIRQLKLPKTIIAVTGSNGKTTATELIAHVFKANGKSVGWNYEGSNQTEGVATLLLRLSSFNGKVKRDIIVMECDERYAKKIFENMRPSILLVTNLCRDQLTRNGHPEFIEDCIRAAIIEAGKVKLVLNTDDPYVAALTRKTWYGSVSQFNETGDDIVPDDILWLGINTASGTSERIGMYDDGAFCPVCKERMTYAYHIAGHFGNYNCVTCGLKRNDPDVEATMQEHRGTGLLCFYENTVSLSPCVPCKMQVKLPGITSAYNFCSAVAVAKAVGISVRDSAKALDGYELSGGRTMQLALGERNGMLLVSKHENTFAYDMSLSWIIEQKKPCTVIVLVDAISRKYFTGETSWLWDINFGLLMDDNVKNIVLAGKYVNELAMRFAMTGVDKAKIGYIADLSGLRDYVEKNTVGDIYAVTCFSDKAKLFK